MKTVERIKSREADTKWKEKRRHQERETHKVLLLLKYYFNKENTHPDKTDKKEVFRCTIGQYM